MLAIINARGQVTSMQSHPGKKNGSQLRLMGKAVRLDSYPFDVSTSGVERRQVGCLRSVAIGGN